MQHRAIAIYSIGLGLAVLLLWAVILTGGPVPEQPGELAFHLASEALMAGACLTAGVALLKRLRPAPRIAIAAHAMVIYSALNAAGYYLEQGVPAVTFAMTALALVSAGILFALLRTA